MRTFNPLFWPTVAFALGLGAVGWRVEAVRARPWQLAAVWTIAASASLPAVLYAAYYAHVLDRAAWFYDLRAVPFSELAASGAGFGVGLLAQRTSRFAARQGSTALARVVPGFLVFLLILLLAVPYAKPVLVPIQLRLGDQWKQGVCIQSTPSTCGPASAATLLRYYGKQATESELAKECFSCGTGTENWYLARALRQRGLPVAVRITRPQPDRLPFPSIAGTQLGGSGGAGHFIAILDQSDGRYLIGDPLSGRSLMTLDQLRARYRLTGFFLTAVKPPPPAVSTTADPFELHGAILVRRYESRSLGVKRRLHVYTPPGYNSSPTRAYPVLYLLHGSPGSDSDWTTLGVRNILDRLIASGRCAPCVVVMPNGEVSRRRYGPRGFERDLLNDVMPWVESNFRVLRDPAGCAIAGLSMGGFQSISIGINHPERFAWVGVFSAGLRAGFVTASDLESRAGGRGRRNLKLIYTRIGTSDFFLNNARRFHAWLLHHSMPQIYQEVAGGHEWSVWRGALEDLLPRLFR